MISSISSCVLVFAAAFLQGCFDHLNPQLCACEDGKTMVISCPDGYWCNWVSKDSPTDGFCQPMKVGDELPYPFPQDAGPDPISASEDRAPEKPEVPSSETDPEPNDPDPAPPDGVPCEDIEAPTSALDCESFTDVGPCYFYNNGDAVACVLQCPEGYSEPEGQDFGHCLADVDPEPNDPTPGPPGDVPCEDIESPTSAEDCQHFAEQGPCYFDSSGDVAVCVLQCPEGYSEPEGQDFGHCLADQDPSVPCEDIESPTSAEDCEHFAAQGPCYFDSSGDSAVCVHQCPEGYSEPVGEDFGECAVDVEEGCTEDNWQDECGHSQFCEVVDDGPNVCTNCGGISNCNKVEYTTTFGNCGKTCRFCKTGYEISAGQTQCKKCTTCNEKSCQPCLNDSNGCFKLCGGSSFAEFEYKGVAFLQWPADDTGFRFAQSTGSADRGPAGKLPLPSADTTTSADRQTVEDLQAFGQMRDPGQCVYIEGDGGTWEYFCEGTTASRAIDFAEAIKELYNCPPDAADKYVITFKLTHSDFSETSGVSGEHALEILADVLPLLFPNIQRIQITDNLNMGVVPDGVLRQLTNGTMPLTTIDFSNNTISCISSGDIIALRRFEQSNGNSINFGDNDLCFDEHGGAVSNKNVCYGDQFEISVDVGNIRHFLRRGNDRDDPLVLDQSPGNDFGLARFGDDTPQKCVQWGDRVMFNDIDNNTIYVNDPMNATEIGSIDHLVLRSGVVTVDFWKAFYLRPPIDETDHCTQSINPADQPCIKRNDPVVIAWSGYNPWHLDSDHDPDLSDCPPDQAGTGWYGPRVFTIENQSNVLLRHGKAKTELNKDGYWPGCPTRFYFHHPQ